MQAEQWNFRHNLEFFFLEKRKMFTILKTYRSSSKPFNSETTTI